MSYTVETTFTKPAGTKWFAETHLPLASRFNKVDRVRATGVENRTVNRIDENTVVITTTWASEADYQTFLSKKGASIADSIRKQYADDNGITATTRVVV